MQDPSVLPTSFQGKFAEAERLYERCQAIDEKVLGPEHPDLAIMLNNRAGLLQESRHNPTSIFLWCPIDYISAQQQDGVVQKMLLRSL